MLFGLKNAGATYQRLMNKVFANHIGKLIEVYVDDMLYEAQIAIKSQYLADFVAEYTDTPRTPIDWNLYVDGSSNKARIGAGVILESDQGTQLELSLRFKLPASNNQAEYEAQLAGLKLVREVGAQKLTIFSDLQIVTSQIEGRYQAKDPTMKKYLDKTREQLENFMGYEI
ncbi:uncharacterized protein [Arachis hypogaea]|uniref:uncharacterized protein n=1 Tax=Arachis hypogaea TaxID=3818 RepID=UPI000DED22F0|nr:uncharacterized protein LOC112778166 [Arachis hypogaea]